MYSRISIYEYSATAMGYEGIVRKAGNTSDTYVLFVGR